MQDQMFNIFVYLRNQREKTSHSSLKRKSRNIFRIIILPLLRDCFYNVAAVNFDLLLLVVIKSDR
jgi:hypothetical protein